MLLTRGTRLGPYEISAPIGSGGTLAFTRGHEILGTASYMSPEQAQGQLVDHRSDIFSFGAVLYELLSGHKTFDGGSMVDVLMFRALDRAYEKRDVFLIFIKAWPSFEPYRADARFQSLLQRMNLA